MSGVLKTISKIAGIVASVAAFIPGGQVVAAVAGAVALVSGIGAQLLYKPPPARGSVNGIVIGAENARPYIVGRSYAGGVLVHDVGYGPTVKKVPNPYRALAIVYSGGGPLDGLESAQADFATVPFSGTAASGYFNGFMWRSFQLGMVPTAAALTGQFGAIPDWTAAHKLSGLAAILWSLKFDRDGKVFASGVPQLGAVWRGALCYDPRKDSTYPGGSGTHRWADPSDAAAHEAAIATWEYTRSPGLHALHYALGRWERPGSSVPFRKTMGIGLPIDGLKVADFVNLANVCDANGWTCDGVVFEPGDRWANLKDMLAAGGARPVFDGGQIGVLLSAPRIALDTIGERDLATDDVSVAAMQSWRARLNTIIPKYRSENHKWEYVSADRVTVSSYRTEDGEEKTETVQWNLVTNVDQATRLAAYALTDGRELDEISLTCKPRMRRYAPGDLLIVDLPERGLIAQPCVVMKRVVDPATMTVQFVLRGETAAKHAFALGRTGVAPPTPTLLSTADRDDVAFGLDNARVPEAIRGSVVVSGGTVILTAEDTGSGTAKINVAAHTWDYPDPTTDVTRSAGSITGIANGVTYFVYFDDDTLANASPTYLTTTVFDTARNTTTNPARHYLGAVTTPAAGGGPSDGTGGGGGGGSGPRPDVPEA